MVTKEEPITPTEVWYGYGKTEVFIEMVEYDEDAKTTKVYLERTLEKKVFTKLRQRMIIINAFQRLKEKTKNQFHLKTSPLLKQRRKKTTKQL